MKFFAQSAVNYILKHVRAGQSGSDSLATFLFMMPSLPEQVVLQIGDQLTQYCVEQSSFALPLIKVSMPLARHWRLSVDSAAVAAAGQIQSKGWFDDDDSLTQYRNANSKNSGHSIKLLIGVDRVTDSSSLTDFHHCNFHRVWDHELQGRFDRWIVSKLEDASIGYDDETVNHFNWVLLPIVDRGLADVLQISTLLEVLDLTTAQDGRDAEKLLLNGLHSFGLPPFSSFRFSTEKAFGVFVDQSLEFFSYDAFIDESKRSAALKKLDKFQQFIDTANESPVSPEDRPSFESDDDFINGIRVYVESGDEDARDKLLNCDFTVIQEKILKFRARSEHGAGGERTPPIKKLNGSPIEVVLAALWSTLGQFKKFASDQDLFAIEAISAVTIKGLEFKHDHDGENSEDRQGQAKEELSRLLGGVDVLVMDYVDDTALCEDDGTINITSNLLSNDVTFSLARTAEPCFIFSVSISAKGFEKPISQKFAWRLPRIHVYRVADELVRWASEALEKLPGNALPVYQVPYFDELMLAKDDEETRRVLSQCVGAESQRLKDLFTAEELDRSDPLFRPIQKLSFVYANFLHEAKSAGLHVALLEKWNDLRVAYEDAADAYLNKPECHQSPLATFLFRAFLIIAPRNRAEGDRWMWEDYEPACAVTVLHPALLEMLHAQIRFLFTAFNSLAEKELKESGRRGFRDALWQDYLDLASIQTPLCGLLKDQNKILETDVRGDSLIHRIGNVSDSDESMTTKLMLRYDSFEDDDVSDSELFHESRESSLMLDVLKDYRKLHPHANDGLSIAIYQNGEIQPVIAAIDLFLQDIFSNRTANSKPYSISVTFFTESSDDSSVARWIAQWKDRWERADSQAAYSHYQDTRLSVAHRIVSTSKNYEQFINIIQDGLEVDIAVLMNFIRAGNQGNDFETVEPYDVTSRRLKFPILEKSFCASSAPGKKLQRARVLSNRQFRITTAHAEVMARLKSPTTSQGTSHVVLGYGDFTPWQGVVDALHSRAEWVVCIDANMDEKLISQRSKASQEAREIIGFGSGVGAHGEANYTISTEHFLLSDVLHKLIASIEELYSQWDTPTYEQVAKSVLLESQKLSGLSLVNATGVGEYIRDFMAYALTRKLLRANNGVLCDQLVSLDAYRHWFSSAESKKRPDLMWLVVRMTQTGRLHLDLRLIECKLAQMSDSHLEKAREQLENGLLHLPMMFMPQSTNTDEEKRPDLRYWWLQLHRLIASKTEIRATDNKRQVLSALERLADGDFDVSWQATALTYWTDKPLLDLTSNDLWPCDIDGKQLQIDVVACGYDFVKKLCAESFSAQLPWSGGAVEFSAALQTDAITDVGKEDEGETDDDLGGNSSDDAGPGGDQPGNDSFASNSQHEKTTQHEAQEEKSQRPSLLDGYGHGVHSTDTNAANTNLNLVSKIPDRILLGESQPGLRKIYWEFGHPKLSNRHMLIFGSSGQGKTYTIECLLSELGRAGQNSLIIDYTNGFMNNQLEPEFKEWLKPQQHFVRQQPLRINPFREQMTILDDTQFPEGASSTAQRVAGVFSEVYNFGDQQVSAMYQAIKKGIEFSGENGMTLKDLIPRLEEIIEEKGVQAQPAGSVISKLRPFLDQNPFGSEEPGSWERLFNDPIHRCHIVQLAGFMGDASRLVTEFSLIDLYWFYRVVGTQKKPRVIVLDEVQNLDHREQSPLSDFLREGRKFGFSLILATQIMSNLDKDERDRLFLAGHKLFFKPADTELKNYADIAAVITGEKADRWQSRLAGLKQGECYSLGPSMNESNGELETKAFKLRVSSLKDRG